MVFVIAAEEADLAVVFEGKVVVVVGEIPVLNSSFVTVGVLVGRAEEASELLPSSVVFVVVVAEASATRATSV